MEKFKGKRQLIVLGNGFDIGCGLHTTYNDYFNYRFRMFDLENKVQEQLNKVGSTDVSALQLIKENLAKSLISKSD